MSLIEEIKPLIIHDFFSALEIRKILGGSAQRRFSLVKRALRAGDVIRLRRGLYILGETLRRTKPNLFVLATRIYGPSYISLESALSAHGWIPEIPQVVTSCSSVRSKQFDTPLGGFIYDKVPETNMLDGTIRISGTQGAYFMAEPWKAIIDYVFVYKKDWVGSDPLLQSLRIAEENVDTLPLEDMHRVASYYRNKRVLRFVHSLQKKGVRF